MSNNSSIRSEDPIGAVTTSNTDLTDQINYSTRMQTDEFYFGIGSENINQIESDRSDQKYSILLRDETSELETASVYIKRENIPSLQSWESEIPRRDNDFKNTGKKRLRFSSSTSFGIFIEDETDRENK